MLGIPAMHSTLDALTRDASLIEKYVALPYLPEFSVVLIIGLVYWRHMSDRQWKLRLDAEKHKREAAENNQALTHKPN